MSELEAVQWWAHVSKQGSVAELETYLYNLRVYELFISQQGRSPDLQMTLGSSSSFNDTHAQTAFRWVWLVQGLATFELVYGTGGLPPDRHVYPLWLLKLMIVASLFVNADDVRTYLTRAIG